MKKYYFLILLVLVTFSAYSAGSWNLQGNVYRVDTLYHTYVGPGTTQTSLKLTGNSVLRVFYTTTDLKNPNVDVRVIKANDKLVGVGTVSSMAVSHSKPGNVYFAGVNADFFGNSAPIGTTIVDGEIYNTNNGWQSFGIDADKVPYVGTPETVISIKSPQNNTAKVTGVNISRAENYLVLYTKRIGAASGTNGYGSEVALVPVDGALKIGNTVKMKVMSEPVNGVGNMEIPTGGYVLSGHGTGAEYIKTLALNDEVEVTATLSYDGKESAEIVQSAGGCPMIVSDGKVLDTQGALDHLTSLNPRTAVGYTADKNKLVMLVVDGRSSNSAGCISKVLADIMINTGCSEAMNFDGGGSSAMYIKELGVRNVPSDGKERAVTDGLYLSTSAPEDNVIAQIRFTDASKYLPKYGYYTPKFYGYNQYGVLIDTDVEGVVLSCDPQLGEIQNNGFSLFCNGEGCHALTGTYNGISTTMPVSVTSGDVAFRINDIIEDCYNGYKVEVQSTVNEETMSLDNQALTWWSEDSSVATVEDGTGVVKGIADGETRIHGKLNDFEGILNVKVEKPVKRHMPIDPNLDAETWKLNQVGGKNLAITPLEEGMKLTYTGASGRGPYIKLTKKIRLWSLPDTIRLMINPGNAVINKVTFSTSANDGGQVATSVDGTLKSNELNEVKLVTSEWCDAKDRSNYPIYLNYIYFDMGTSTTGQEYTIEIPNIETVYQNVEVSGVADVIVDSDIITVYPNPVNEGENATIKMNGSGTYHINIFSEDGKLMSGNIFESNEGMIQLPTSSLSRGLYFVSVSGNNMEGNVKLIIK